MYTYNYYNQYVMNALLLYTITYICMCIYSQYVMTGLLHNNNDRLVICHYLSHIIPLVYSVHQDQRVPVISTA